jgi:hypothetical protein
MHFCNLGHITSVGNKRRPGCPGPTLFDPGVHLSVSACPVVQWFCYCIPVLSIPKEPVRNLHEFQIIKKYIINQCKRYPGKISARTPLFFHGSSAIFQIEKTFRPEISLFLGMKHFWFQPGIEPAPTSTWATRYSVRVLNQLRYRGTHESLAQVIEVLSLHVLLVVRRANTTDWSIRIL